VPLPPKKQMKEKEEYEMLVRFTGLSGLSPETDG
jgi:hypothetical protein